VPDGPDMPGGEWVTGPAGLPVPVPYVVSSTAFDGMELMLNAGRGVQTLIADADGRIVAAVVPVSAWYPGARVPDGVRIRQPGEWFADAIGVRARRRAERDHRTGSDGPSDPGDPARPADGGRR
jgi:hypothetical protein